MESGLGEEAGLERERELRPALVGELEVAGSEAKAKLRSRLAALDDG